MIKQSKILTLLLAIASPAALACNPAEGSGRCGFIDAYGGWVGTKTEQTESYQRLYNENTYVEPAPVYRPPPPPPTHDCTAREGGETCFDIRPGRIGSSYSTNAAGDFDGPMVESYPDGTPKSITNYRNGEMAESTHYYPDGAIETVMPHQNGEIHGIVKHYRQNGTLEYEIPFCNGETCGEQHNYDEQGNIVKITRFDANGDIESVQEIAPGNSAKQKPRRKS